VCADHTGEFADISVGDPWHLKTGSDEPGRSLVVVRTERGRRILRQAVRDGHLVLDHVDPSVLPAAQRNLLRGRGAVWGRILGCRLLGAPVPKYHRMPMFRFWWSQLTLNEKIRSVVGSMRRVLSRRIGSRVVVEPLITPPASQDAPFKLTPVHAAGADRPADRLAA
jgi:coenzyme F420 hydrogenase subunit beta